jgi:hypothetical protein
LLKFRAMQRPFIGIMRMPARHMTRLYAYWKG